MQVIRILFFLLWALVVCESACAQESGAEPVWSLQECVAYALEHNLQVRKQRLGVEGAAADLKQAKGQFLPDLNASAVSSWSSGTNRGELDGESAYTSSASLNTALVLYQGGALRTDLKRTNLALEGAVLSVDQIEDEVVVQVIEQFLNVLYATENLRYYEQVVAGTEAQVRQAKAFFAAGGKAHREVLDLEAQLAADRYTALSASQLLNQQKSALKQLLEMPVDKVLEFGPLKEAEDASWEKLPSLEEVFAAALGYRPELKKQELGLTMAELDLRSARSAYLPQLALSAGLSSNYSNGNDAGFIQQFSDSYQKGLSLQLKIPLFNRYATQSVVKRQRLALQESSLELENTRNLILQSAERRYEDAEAALARYHAAVVQENATMESYAYAQELYRLGMINAMEVLQVRNVWLNAGKEEIQAKYTALLQRRVLQHYIGIWEVD